MSIDQRRDNSKQQEIGWIIRRGRKALATAAVFIVAFVNALSSFGQSIRPETSEPNAPTDDLFNILQAKDTAIAQADQQYADWVAAANKSYEQLILKAQTGWSQRVTDARATTSAKLKALSCRLAAEGKLDETVRALKAVYALTPRDSEAIDSLTALGVDIQSIPVELDCAPFSRNSQTSKIVIWNTHNGRFNTSGTLQCNVVLLQDERPVWRVNRLDLPWKRNEDTFAVVHAPAIQFEALRVELLKWHGYSGGLAEIEVWEGGNNIALHRPTKASAAADSLTTSARVTDGITSSVAYKNGYWLLPDQQAGWIEIDLAKPTYHNLIRAKVSARRPWQEVMKVNPGDIIDITASGRWHASPQIVAGPDGGIGFGGDQWGKYRERFYLQGRLNGQVFKIGSKYALEAPEAGVLEMGMNEQKITWFTNNSGFLDVALCKHKPLPESENSLSSERLVSNDADGGLAGR